MQRHHRNILLLGGVGFVLIAALIVTLAIVRQPEAVYAPTSPPATVAGFLKLLEKGQVDQAFALTTGATDRQSFHLQFGAWRNTTHLATLVETTVTGAAAQVTVDIRYGSGGALGLPEPTYRATFDLIWRADSWRIDYWYGIP